LLPFGRITKKPFPLVKSERLKNDRNMHNKISTVSASFTPEMKSTSTGRSPGSRIKHLGPSRIMAAYANITVAFPFVSTYSWGDSFRITLNSLLKHALLPTLETLYIVCTLLFFLYIVD